jgi:tRNA(Arg) A34 adenosine deaminase TadA
MLLIWLLSFFTLPIKSRFQKNSEVWAFSLIIIIHFVWLFNTNNFEYAFADIQKKLALLVIPLIMASMPTFGLWKRNFLLNLFVLTIFAAGVSVLLAKWNVLEAQDTNPRNYSVFISHIRLSLMIVLSMFINAYFVIITQIKKHYKILHIAAFIFSIISLLVLQAFTGMLIFFITFLIIAPIFMQKIKQKKIRLLSYSLIGLTILSSLLFVGWHVYSFYHTKNPYPENLSLTTSQGNPYMHRHSSNEIENGNKVYYFVNHHELRHSWSKVSEINIDSLDKKGHTIRHTLIRYLTSMGEFKDAEAVNKLSKADIEAIEAGICNVRFKNGEGNAARLYYTIWQLHNYVHGGNPSGQSITQRIEHLKTGWHIFKDNPILGIGTGDVDDYFKHQYRLDKSPLLPEFRHRAHNQYLTFMISFGLFGFLIFLCAWFFPAIRNQGFKNYFFLVFFIIASLSMLSEDSFETLTGSAFIATFYSLFLWGTNYKLMFQEKFMRKAIVLAKENIKTGNGPFGAVIVKNGEIIAETSNSVTRDNDPTAHAEVNAIRQACEKLQTFDLSGCEIYSSCEPCPMCLGAIYWAQLDKLYFASSRQDAASAGFNDEFIYEEFAKNIRERKIPTRQIMKEEADVVFRTWDEFEDKIRY